MRGQQERKIKFRRMLGKRAGLTGLPMTEDMEHEAWLCSCRAENAFIKWIWWIDEENCGIFRLATVSLCWKTRTETSDSLGSVWTTAINLWAPSPSVLSLEAYKHISLCLNAVCLPSNKSWNNPYYPSALIPCVWFLHSMCTCAWKCMCDHVNVGPSQGFSSQWDWLSISS